MIGSTTNVLALSLLLLAVAGCTQESKDKYGQAGEELKQAAKTSGEAIKKDAEVAAEASKAAARQAQQSFEKSAANDVLTSGKVKAAIIADRDVSVDNLEVESGKGKVTLRGKVSKQADWDRAGVIAAKAAGERYVIDNELAVGRK